ncbi:uncharacterized protein PHACADRAFT_142987 [Phanerochaete carnosa HHB-10118-sp]|uniref:Uncharacterized protein n=1 Tax=Phanerochaete carnosa (strain HHB-10118-sp) TaxID=650164 RepID=K5W7E1_PHACS|nr:uncharacterized protein PHACADRAFT_142987 [Phanerochaete carnosa HHB-10118-sp]EKM55090.1 hypothetical protein PHACADRAFT_142987 [Phanerochaete carnosa HHB-10118-sp]
MSTWRGTFTFNKYSEICARALRQSLKETERVAAEKRGSTILRYQEWKDGQGGQQVCALSLARVLVQSVCGYDGFSCNTVGGRPFHESACYVSPRRRV